MWKQLDDPTFVDPPGDVHDRVKERQLAIETARSTRNSRLRVAAFASAVVVVAAVITLVGVRMTSDRDNIASVDVSGSAVGTLNVNGVSVVVSPSDLRPDDGLTDLSIHNANSSEVVIASYVSIDRMTSSDQWTPLYIVTTGPESQLSNVFPMTSGRGGDDMGISIPGGETLTRELTVPSMPAGSYRLRVLVNEKVPNPQSEASAGFTIS